MKALFCHSKCFIVFPSIVFLVRNIHILYQAHLDSFPLKLYLWLNHWSWIEGHDSGGGGSPPSYSDSSLPYVFYVKVYI